VVGLLDKARQFFFGVGLVTCIGFFAQDSVVEQYYRIFNDTVVLGVCWLRNGPDVTSDVDIV